MSNKHDDGVRAIAEHIEKYLEKNPRASDDLEGIRQWWLPAGLTEESPANVQQALDELKKGEVVATKQMPDGRLLYVKNFG